MVDIQPYALLQNKLWECVLRPALELKSHIVYLKDVEANTGISYGSTYVTTKRTKIFFLSTYG